MKNLFIITTIGLYVMVSCEPKKEKMVESSPVTTVSAGESTAVNTDTASGGIYIKYAHAYNNFIIERQGNILEEHIAFSAAAQNDESPETIEKLYKNLVNQTTNSIDTLKKLGPFNGNSAFKNAAIELFTFYQEAWSDYAPLLGVKDKKEKAKVLESIRVKFNETHSIKEKKLEEDFMKAHTDFVNEYKLHVRSSSLHETLDSLLVK